MTRRRHQLRVSLAVSHFLHFEIQDLISFIESDREQSDHEVEQKAQGRGQHAEPLFDTKRIHPTFLDLDDLIP